jgi:hypothetical protein
MADSDLIIKLDTDAYKQDPHAPVRGGGTRVVYAIPTGLGILPMIWLSHTISKNDEGVPVYACLLLASKDPPQTIQGEISVEAVRSANIPTTVVEW